MAEKYAELELYYDLCNSDGCGEGRFLPNSESEYSVNRFNRAMRTVERYLLKNCDYGLRLGYPRFVRDEDEAKTLIQFSEQNIKGASSLIELVDCMHGEIAFERKIYFESWVKSQQKELLQELKKSGYVPRDEQRERLEMGLAPGETLEDKYWNELVEADIKKLDPNRPWKEALKFF